MRHRVVKHAVIRRSVVLLNVSRIEVVQHVVHRYSRTKLNTMAVELEVHGILELRVEPHKCGEPPRLVLAAKIIPALIKPRKWEPGVHVQYRHKVHPARQPDNPPEETAIGGVR